MIDLLELLRTRFSAAIATLGDEVRDADPLVRPSDRADFQANAAMSLAKRLKRPPRDVAAAIVEALELADVAEEVGIAGPGFINVTVRSGFVAEQLTAQHVDPRAGLPPHPSPQTVVIDYSSPNVAKEMHVGHLRSTIIGDALARILEARDHRVIRQNHLGDWGTPFGMLIEHLLDLGTQADDELAIGDLNAFYKAARAKFDGDEAFADRSRQRVVKLQGGDEDTLVLWRRLVAASESYFSKVYEALGVGLGPDDSRGESSYQDELADVVTELQRIGLAKESDGAQCVFPEGFTGREGDPLPLIVQKSDGGYGYAVTDLAAIRHRTRDLKADRILYVVGTPQHQHLEMVFQVAREAGWLDGEAEAVHVNFGSVLGSDGKMFKTRSGETVKLMDLIEEALERARAEVSERFEDLDDDTRAQVAQQVGVGSLKFADLTGNRVKDYTFDLDRMITFEGSSAGYVQYAHARCRSIFRRAGGEPEAGPIAVEHEAERALAMKLLSFGRVVEQVERTLEPHTLCGYLFEVADAFSSFYDQCPVLKSEGDVQTSRLRIVQLTSRVLAKGLGLLGIEAPERM